jgi:diacylglycerol kinase
MNYLKNRLKSMQHAANGIYLLLRNEPNARIHLICAILVICLSLFVGLSTIEWCLIALAIGMVFISEAFNSAIENLSDIVSPDYNEKIKVIKDLSAGGVLISAIAAVAIACLVLFPKIIELVSKS